LERGKKEMLPQLVELAAVFSGHSFRRGYGMTAAEKGAPPHRIQGINILARPARPYRDCAVHLAITAEAPPATEKLCATRDLLLSAKCRPEQSQQSGCYAITSSA
jgi:hypothetical protein